MSIEISSEPNAGMEDNSSTVTPEKKKKPMTHEERMELAAKLDKELDDFIAGLEKRSCTESWPEDRWEEVPSFTVWNTVIYSSEDDSKECQALWVFVHQEMANHPFFMKEVPQDGSIPPLLEGIQQLKYDENENTPIELALSYKEDGNFNFGCKKYRMAIISYTEGIKTNCGDNILEAQLYGNRSAAQFQLGNYKSSLLDCRMALKRDPNYKKVKMRAAHCCLKLKKFKEAIQYCDEILQDNPEESNAIKIRRQVVNSQNVEERNIRRRECVEKILQGKREAIKAAVEKRNITLDIEGDILESLKTAEQKPVLDDEVLHWPVYFLYPEHSMSDFIEQFSETSTFIEHLEEMFVIPPTWDPEYEYRPEDLTVYFEGYDKSTLYGVNVMDTLGDVLSSGKYVIRDWKPSFLIFVRGSKAEINFLKNYTLKS